MSNAGWDEPLGRIRWAGDRATVEFRRRYATDAADLWQAVTDPERLARWFAPVTGHATPGGEFTLHFDDADAPRCVVLACDPPRSFRWRWDHGAAASEVGVAVQADGEGAVLTVRHSLLDPTSAGGLAAGWHAHLLGLRAHLDGREPGDWWASFGSIRAAYEAALAAGPST